MITYKIFKFINHYWLFLLGFGYVVGVSYFDLILGDFLTKGESYLLATIMALVGVLLGKLEDVLLELKHPDTKDGE